MSIELRWHNISWFSISILTYFQIGYSCCDLKRFHSKEHRGEEAVKLVDTLRICLFLHVLECLNKLHAAKSRSYVVYMNPSNVAIWHSCFVFWKSRVELSARKGFLWFSSFPPDRCHDSTSYYVPAITSHIFSNSLFTNIPIILWALCRGTFYPEDGGTIFLHNVGIHVPN